MSGLYDVIFEGSVIVEDCDSADVNDVILKLERDGYVIIDEVWDDHEFTVTLIPEVPY